MTPETASDTSFQTFFASWELFGTPAMAGGVAGLLVGTLGVYILLRRLVFLAAALSQAAGLGVALAFFIGHKLGIETQALPAAGAALSTGAAAFPFFRTGASADRRDARMALAWLVGAAGALAIGSLIPDAEGIHALLFGSAVVVLPDQFHALLELAVFVLVLHVWWMRGFIQASLDPDGARVRGVPVGILNGALLVTVALSVSFATRVLGALPVFAFSVLPALAALRLVRTVPRALVVAAIVGAVSGFAGYVLAFRFSLPVGAAQALLAAVFVGMAELVHKVRGR